MDTIIIFSSFRDLIYHYYLRTVYYDIIYMEKEKRKINFRNES